MDRSNLRKVKFKRMPTGLLGYVLSIFGININKTEIGYFHQNGFSGKQTTNKPDISIIEQADGTVVTIPVGSFKYV